MAHHSRMKTRKSSEGYNLVASAYERSPWYGFWDRNEVPWMCSKVSTWASGVVLDAGCGTGRYGAMLEGLGHILIGVDTSKAMLDIYRRKLPKASVIEVSITGLTLPSASVDNLICNRVLSHSEHLRFALKEFARVLKPGGHALISDIHPHHDYKQTSFKADGEKISIDTFKHDISEFRKLCELEGFDIEELQEVSCKKLRTLPEGSTFVKLRRAPDRPIFWMASLRRRPIRQRYDKTTHISHDPSLSLSA
jgi:SAM-dependent methyltransferase